MQLWTTANITLALASKKENNLDIQDRIDLVTNDRYMPTDLLTRRNSSRELRMAFAAWILVCKFESILYGGFVRDWIVGNYTSRPRNVPPKKWIQYHRSKPRLHEAVVPADLDCRLPTNKSYDIKEIIDNFEKAGMQVRLYDYPSLYLLLLDANTNTGPFIIDLNKPNSTSTYYHSMHIDIDNSIDFDVNNLFVQKNCTNCLGMRFDITKPPYSITVDEIVTNINRKSFHLLSEIDNTRKGQVINERFKKMERRGWKCIDQKGLKRSSNPGIWMSPCESQWIPTSSPMSISVPIDQYMQSQSSN